MNIESATLHGPLEPRDAVLGNKAKNLKAISELPDLKTPKGCAVLPDVSRSIIAIVRPALDEAIKSLDYGAAYVEIERAISAVDTPDLDRWWEATQSALALPGPYAVRSSGHPVVGNMVLAEDSAANSLAGQYSSYLNVSRDDVVCSIKLCIASLFNARSLELFNVREDRGYLDGTMTVLIQEMITAQVSGVMMTVDPIEGNPDLLGIEGGCGPCSQYVDGSSQGDFLLVSRSDGSVLSTDLGSKNGLYCQANQICATDSPCFSPNQVESLLKAGLAIDAYFSGPQDVEFAFDENSTLNILQVRPITTN